MNGGSQFSFGNGVTIAPGGLGNNYGVLTLTGGVPTIGSGTVVYLSLSKDPDYYPTNRNMSFISAKNSQLLSTYGSGGITMPATLNLTINMPDGTLGYGRYALIGIVGTTSSKFFPKLGGQSDVGGRARPRAATQFSYINDPNGYNWLVLDGDQPAPACPAPNSYNVTGGTNCSSTGITVGLSGLGRQQHHLHPADQLGVSTGITMAGDNAAENFAGTQTAPATYTVSAQATCGGGPGHREQSGRRQQESRHHV